MRPVLRTLRFLLPLAALAILGTASSANAQITNGSFETGDYTGYTTTGNASVEQESGLFEPPTNGTFEALIQTTTTVPPSGGGGSPVSVAALDSFLGTGTALETNPSGFTNGSAFKQTFSATAGSSLSFDTNFLTNELTNGTGNPDQAFAILLNNTSIAASPSEGTPPQATQSANALDPIFFNETGYSTTTFGASDFTSTGSYTIEFVVLNAGDESVDSGLLVDNLVLTLGPGGGGGGGAVPLPASFWAGIIGCFFALGTAFTMGRKAAL